MGRSEAAACSHRRALRSVVEAIAVSAEEAAKLLGVSVRTLRTMTPRLPHLRTCDKNGSKVLYPVDALREWANREARERVR